MKKNKNITYIENVVEKYGVIPISKLPFSPPPIYSKLGNTHYDVITSINKRSCSITSYEYDFKIDESEYGYLDLDDAILESIVCMVQEFEKSLK
jgi:hypothetical protein